MRHGPEAFERFEGHPGPHAPKCDGASILSVVTTHSKKESRFLGDRTFPDWKIPVFETPNFYFQQNLKKICTKIRL